MTGTLWKVSCFAAALTPALGFRESLQMDEDGKGEAGQKARKGWSCADTDAPTVLDWSDRMTGTVFCNPFQSLQDMHQRVMAYWSTCAEANGKTYKIVPEQEAIGKVVAAYDKDKVTATLKFGSPMVHVEVDKEPTFERPFTEGIKGDSFQAGGYIWQAQQQELPEALAACSYLMGWGFTPITSEQIRWGVFPDKQAFKEALDAMTPVHKCGLGKKSIKESRNTYNEAQLWASLAMRNTVPEDKWGQHRALRFLEIDDLEEPWYLVDAYKALQGMQGLGLIVGLQTKAGAGRFVSLAFLNGMRYDTFQTQWVPRMYLVTGSDEPQGVKQVVEFRGGDRPDMLGHPIKTKWGEEQSVVIEEETDFSDAVYGRFGKDMTLKFGDAVNAVYYRTTDRAAELAKARCEVKLVVDFVDKTVRITVTDLGPGGKGTPPQPPAGLCETDETIAFGELETFDVLAVFPMKALD